ncbi:hypothetical protein [Chitinolyticbacter albus]|uniref:hypothetical protein n=1 Tax=Chitinolyticbacter albus TaxID=2961951 RepID=UPI00210952F7|nr:hypothetical protein [Chitinolyticbacter albus]
MSNLAFLHEAAMRALGKSINLVVQELTQTGVMEPGRLFELPFTDVYAQGQGPLGVFPPAGVERLLEVLETIRRSAA